MPKKKCMLKRDIQSKHSINWNFEVELSKKIHKNIEHINVTKEKRKAICFIKSVLYSGIMSIDKIPKIGRVISKDSI